MAKDYLSTRSGLVAINRDQNIVSAGDLSKTKQDVSQWSGKGGLLHNKGWAVCDGSTYDPLVFPELDAALGNPVSKVVPNGPYRTPQLTEAIVSISNDKAMILDFHRCIAYTDSFGNWRLKGNFRLSGTSTSSDRINIGISGILFLNTDDQTMNMSLGSTTGTGITDSYLQAVRAQFNTNNIFVELPASTVIGSLLCDYDVALESKPTWADANLEDYPIIATANNVLSNSLGLPEPTTSVAGLWSTDQVNEVLVNECINGSFDFNQRGGASYTVAGDYTLDRFRIDHLGGTTNTVSQEEFINGQIEVDGNPNHYTRIITTSGNLSNSLSIYSTKIENLSKYSDKWVTVGVDLKADSNKQVSFEFVQNFGTGGSPDTAVTAIGVNKISVTNTWKRYYFTAKIDSVSGKTFGTDGNDNLQFFMWFDAGSDFNARTDSLGNQSGTFEIANLDIKLTKLQTPFTRAGGTYAGELALCERYYEVIESTGRLVSTGVADGNWFARGEFKTKKRGPISLSVYYDSINGAIGQVRQYGGASLAVTVSPNSIDSYQIVNDSGATVSPYGITYGLRIDAEL